MLRRCCALAVVLVIVCAPIATALCQMTCASHGAAETPAHAAHHSCAPPADAASPATVVTALPHTCGHPADVDTTVAIEQSLQALLAPAVLDLDLALAPPLQPVSHASPSRHIEHSPPGLLARTAQLRV